MAKKITTVEDSFFVEGRGLVVTGVKEKNPTQLKVGDFIKILRPNKSTVKSQIDGVETFFSRKDSSKSPKVENVAFSLKNISKKDVPRGSIIYLIV